jgi:hypothetical protein
MGCTSLAQKCAKKREQVTPAKFNENSNKSGRQKPTVLKRVIKFQPLFSIDQTTVFVIFMKIGLGIVQKIHVTFHSF